MYQNKKQIGFSLVELLVALVLGLVVSAAAIQIFASNKGTYRLENALSRLQENGRFVVDQMINDLRMAGYNGCLSRGAGVPVNDITPGAIATSNAFVLFPYAIDGTDSIRGFNYGTSDWVPSLDASLNLSGVVANTDVINIQRASSCGAQLTSAPTSTGDTAIDVVDPNGCDFTANEVVMITDCSVADVFQIGSLTTGTDTVALNRAGGTLSAIYSQASQVFRWQSTAYFVGTDANGQPALFRSSWTPDGDNDIQADDFTTLALASGIEDMQLLYGIDTGMDEYADAYVTANNVTNWDAVRSIRIGLLLRSDNNITQEPRSIQFNGATVNPVATGDRRLRTVYTTTVSLRNNTP
ncbi:MAG: prepilin-type N-terminal cleavage/methylation domain-containing protein [Gammaproteobacteria bacterium]|nr:MAG: prepilin-type N-terminal cleavage/methylation domain-containing protein [Gammaproteobacteria bacterium]